jgi:hypothetical protein
MAVRKCSKSCQLFRVFRGRALFLLSRRACSSEISWRIFSLVKKTLRRHRAGFETQRASPFRKWIKSPKYSEKPHRPERWPLSLCYPLQCWWCWRALPAVINTFVKSLHCSDHHPIKIGDERERLVTASPVMTKSRAPAGGNNYLENGLLKPPRRDTRTLSPAGIFGGKAPLRLAAQKSRLHAPSVPMRSAPAYFLCKWGV